MSKLTRHIAGSTLATDSVEIEAVLLTGGFDKPYAFGLAMALISRCIRLDVIGSDAVDGPAMHTTHKLRFLNLRSNQRPDASLAEKTWRLLVLYAKLIRYAISARQKIFHILWNNRFEYFDRTLLMLFYKVRGKKIVLTAHNVNAAKRDSRDTLLNRITLKIQYRLADHIFVHSEKMRRDLIEEFDVPEEATSVIPFGVNNAVPRTSLTPGQAKERLGISGGERTLLFFGRIVPYKGLEFLVAAFQKILASNSDYRLIIAGNAKKGSDRYLGDIKRTISRDLAMGRVITRIEYIPDEETELYFKAADVFVLPYTQVFQSGVLFLGYSFGLPVIATCVGSFREEIIEGRTGFLCGPCDSIGLAKTIETYFASDLYRDLDGRRQEIRDYVNVQHSWDVVSELTRKVYVRLLEEYQS